MYAVCTCPVASLLLLQAAWHVVRTQMAVVYPSASRSPSWNINYLLIFSLSFSTPFNIGLISDCRSGRLNTLLSIQCRVIDIAPLVSRGTYCGCVGPLCSPRKEAFIGNEPLTASETSCTTHDPQNRWKHILVSAPCTYRGTLSFITYSRSIRKSTMSFNATVFSSESECRFLLSW